MGYIIKLSLANLKQRKLRTVLTIIGIMIGIMSVVTMLTAGMGARESMVEQVEKSGSTREIRVYATSNKRKDRLLTDDVAVKLGRVDNVEEVYPVLDISGDGKINGYITWGNLTGVSMDYINVLSETAEIEGKLPKKNGSRPELLFGKGVRNTLYNEKTFVEYSKSVNKEKALAGNKIDITISLPEEDKEEEEEKKEDTATATDAEKIEPEEEEEQDNTKTFKLDVVGEISNEYDYNIYTDIDTLKVFLKRMSVDGKIPGQPLDKNNQPYNEWIYSYIIVRVDNTQNVEHVSKVISDMGYRVENNLEMLKSVNKTVGTMQLILGIVGSIAAVVAIIGIINTMMTAVYDRIREISLLKMLGADSDDISFMFFFESAFLGFTGGVLGVLLSMLAGLFINKKLVQMMEMAEGSYIMNTPPWLILTAIIISVVVAILASVFPTRWATKIKPLEGMTM